MTKKQVIALIESMPFKVKDIETWTNKGSDYAILDLTIKFDLDKVEVGND